MRYEQPRFTVQRLDPASFAGQYGGIVGPSASPDFVAATGLDTKQSR